jgi:hypothetical protein
MLNIIKSHNEQYSKAKTGLSLCINGGPRGVVIAIIVIIKDKTKFATESKT